MKTYIAVAQPELLQIRFVFAKYDCGLIYKGCKSTNIFEKLDRQDYFEGRKDSPKFSSVLVFMQYDWLPCIEFSANQILIPVHKSCCDLLLSIYSAAFNCAQKSNLIYMDSNTPVFFSSSHTCSFEV